MVVERQKGWDQSLKNVNGNGSDVFKGGSRFSALNLDEEGNMEKIKEIMKRFLGDLLLIRKLRITIG